MLRRQLRMLQAAVLSVYNEDSINPAMGLILWEKGVTGYAIPTSDDYSAGEPPVASIEVENRFRFLPIFSFLLNAVVLPNPANIDPIIYPISQLKTYKKVEEKLRWPLQ